MAEKKKAIWFLKNVNFVNKRDYIFTPIKYHHLSHHLKTKTVLAVKVVGRLYVFACISPFPPFFLSYFPSFFLPLDELGSYMNISLENCHLCCWLRTGINVDCINIRRLDFFFFTRKKKQKKSLQLLLVN